MLSFNYLAGEVRKESEKVMSRTRSRRSNSSWPGDRGDLFVDQTVRVTANKPFAEPFTRLHPGDQVAIVPGSPNPTQPPVQPKGQNEDW